MRNLLPVLITCLSLCLFPPAHAQAPEGQGQVLHLQASQITPYLSRQFPLRLQPGPDQLAVRLSRPSLSLAGPHAALSADVALDMQGSLVPLGRATFTSGLRLDAASAAIYLDKPRLQRITQPDGQSWTLDPSLASVLATALDERANRTPVYTLPAAWRSAAARVQSVSIADNQVHIQLR